MAGKKIVIGGGAVYTTQGGPKSILSAGVSAIASVTGALSKSSSSFPTAPIPPSSYSLPGSYSTAANGAALSSLLSGSPTGGNIVLTGSTYAASGYFNNPNGYNIYSQTLGSATFSAGVRMVGGTIQGCAFNITSGSNGTVSSNSAIMSDGANTKVFDCTINGNWVISSGVWDTGNNGFTVQRVTVQWVYGYGVGGQLYPPTEYYQTNNSGTPVWNTITDISINGVCTVYSLAASMTSSQTTINTGGSITGFGPTENPPCIVGPNANLNATTGLPVGSEFMSLNYPITNPASVNRGQQGTSAIAHNAGEYVFVPGDSDGRAEAGLWIGQPVQNGVARLHIINVAIMGVWTGTNCWNTTISDYYVDMSTFLQGSAVGHYSEHMSIGNTYTRFHFVGCERGFNFENDDAPFPRTTTSSFTQPAIGSNVTISATTGTVTLGYADVYISDGTHTGHYAYISGSSVLQNLGRAGDATPGTVFSSGALVAPGSAANHINTITNGIIDYLNGQTSLLYTDYSDGILLDSGSESTTVTNVTFLNQRDNGINVSNNIGTNVYSGNNYSGMQSGAGGRL